MSNRSYNGEWIQKTDGAPPTFQFPVGMSNRSYADGTDDIGDEIAGVLSIPRGNVE